MPWPNWRKLSLWQINVLIWSIFAVMFFGRSLLHLETLPAVGISLFHLTVCIAFTSLLIHCYHKLEDQGGFGIGTAAWIIGLSLAATLLQSVAAHGLVELTGWRSDQWHPFDVWLMRVMFFWLIYMSWSLLYFWLRAEKAAEDNVQRAFEAQADAQRLELQLLRSQLDPHFLFNALNGIASVVQTDSPAASSMVRELADYLRYSLDHRHDTMVPLATEIDAMMGYLHIEQARFAEELHVEITTDEVARQRQVPCFILLPLVENAVKHSFQACEPPWHVNLSAESREDGRLTITVCNTGTLASKAETGSGAGLEILQRRLDLHYPGRHRLGLSEENGMVCATLELEGDPCSA